MDYEAEDKHATLWGNAAVESRDREKAGKYPMNMLELSNMVKCYPVGEDEFRRYVRMAEKWGIKTNISNDLCWTQHKEIEWTI